MRKYIFITLLLTSALSAKNSFSLGLQNTVFANGLSGKLDISKKGTLQLVIGNGFTLRGLYKFKQKRRWNVYGFLSLSSYKWKHSNNSETVLGLGGGVEYDLRGLDSSFIPLFVNIEIGTGLTNSIDNGLGLGLGIHYKF